MQRIPEECYKLAAECLVYDETSPSCLRWKNGKAAGCQDKDGYWLVRVGSRPGTLLKTHRVIWFMHHGTLPDLIDHRDTNPAHNRIGNLREATESQNRHNSRGHRDSTTGVKGVSWDPRTESWMVKCTLNYKSHWGGRFKSLDEAVAAAQQLRTQLHGEFAKHD